MYIIKNENDYTIYFMHDDLPSTTEENTNCIKFNSCDLISAEQLPQDIEYISLSDLSTIFLNSQHIKCEEIDMKAYGRGVVAKQLIPLGTEFIYMGLYATQDKQNPRGCYNFGFPERCPNSLKVDAQNINCVARLFQDLPEDHHDPIVATANFSSYYAYTAIEQEDGSMGYLPVVLQKANRDIETNELMGFCYSLYDSYWANLGVAPALFKKNGDLYEQTFGLKLQYNTGMMILPSLGSRFFSTFKPGPGYGLYLFRITKGYGAIYFPPNIARHLEAWIRETLPSLGGTSGTYYQVSCQLPFMHLPCDSIRGINNENNQFWAIKLLAEDANDCRILDAQTAMLEKIVPVDKPPYWRLNLDKFKSISTQNELLNGHGFTLTQINPPLNMALSSQTFFHQPTLNSDRVSKDDMIEGEKAVSKNATVADQTNIVATGTHPAAS